MQVTHDGTSGTILDEQELRNAASLLNRGSAVVTGFIETRFGVETVAVLSAWNRGCISWETCRSRVLGPRR